MSLFNLHFIPDVEIHHLETRCPLEFSNIRVVAQGPLRAAVRADVKYGQSTISVMVGFFSFGLSLILNHTNAQISLDATTGE